MLKFRNALFAGIIILCASLTSCSQNYVGKWEGNVLIVNVIYDFKKDNTFTQGSYASNDVLVGGSVGLYEVQEDVITLFYTKSYSFDKNTNTGSWIDVNRSKSFKYEVSHNEMALTELETDFTMNLTKK
ncbi:MAG: hypothetical protein PQJ60_14705 [Spirochaetales bacterium]|nr:hypothetical protein [Spirochaetales bacterium]